MRSVPRASALWRGLAMLGLAMAPAVATGQAGSTSELRLTDELSARAKEPAAKAKPPQRAGARATETRRKAAARANAASSAQAVAPLAAGELLQRTAAELEALITRQRSAVKASSGDETARRNLGLISVEAANRVLQAQALGRAQEVSAYVALIRGSLADTLWRVTQLAREDPVRAQAALGLFHADGILAPRDPARGCDYFSRAAAAGHIAAAYRTSQCLSAAEPERARRWLEQSAAGGNAAAQEALGRSCIEGASVDAACAKKWLEPAAAQGRVSAISVLAWLYAREETPKSLSRASSLYRAAAEAGDPAAQNNLGELFETGRGVAREPAQALDWYRRSAEGGFAPAQFNLARMLAFGIGGTVRDSAAAREWATRAQAQGIAQATELLKLIAEADSPR